MDTHPSTHTSTEVHLEDGHGAPHGTGPMDPSLPMFLWTLGTFAVVAFVLAKFAWKPILAGLDNREEELRKSVENAEHLEEELAHLDDKRREVLADADNQSKEIIAAARKGATEAARVIEDKAKEESQILIENASREIRAAEDRARAALKKESAELVIQLAGKIVDENLDDERNRKLTNKLIEQI